MKLYDFQINAANFIINRLKSMLPVIDCSVVGAGKTFIALHVLKQVSRNFIVVCPKIVISHWKENIQDAELQSLCIDVINYEKLKFGNTPYFTVYNNEQTTPQEGRRKKPNGGKWNIPKNSIIIFDEAHKLKGFNTINSTLLLNIPLHEATPYLISATIADSPLAFVNVAKAFKICINEYKFLAAFGYSKPHPQRGWVFDDEKEHLIRLHNILFHEQSHPGVRITYDQITILTRTNTVKLLQIDDTFQRVKHLYDLIDTTLEDQVGVCHNNAPKKANDELFYSLMIEAQNALNIFDSHLLDKLENTILIEYADDVLVKRTRLKQFIELIKTKLILPRIIEDYNNGKSIVIMLNYSWSINLLYNSIQSLTRNLSKRPSFPSGPKGERRSEETRVLDRREESTDNESTVGIITGSSKNRTETIQAFQENHIRILIINTKAAGVGISLHDTTGEYQRVSYISPSDNIYELQQALGRIYRATSKSDAYQYFITVKNTIETSVYQNYMNKLNMMSRILTGASHH